jgi:hypothetical protein
MILNTRTLGSSRFRQPWLSDVKIKGGKDLGYTHALRSQEFNRQCAG